MEQKNIENLRFSAEELEKLRILYCNFIIDNQKEKHKNYHYWTFEQRETVLRMVLEYFCNNEQINWKKIAKKLGPKFKANSCRSYYHIYLKESFKKVCDVHQAILDLSNKMQNSRNL